MNSHYDTLEIPKTATADEIKKAYRKLAMKWHPDKNKSPKSKKKFQEIAEAYEVLSDAEKKKMYDTYGTTSGLNPENTGFGFNPSNFDGTGGFPSGFPGGFGGIFPGRTSSVDPFMVFQQFFNNTNDFSSEQNVEKSIEHTLGCSLEELYKGCTKKMAITRRGMTGNEEKKILEVNVKKGWKDGTKIRFEKEGDRNLGSVPADIVFIIKSNHHERFIRDNNDLIYTHKLPIQIVLDLSRYNSYSFVIETLDGRSLNVRLSQFSNKLQTSNDEHVLVNEGMPISKEINKKGNLRIRYIYMF